MKIYLDFDDTIFDTRAFAEDLSRIFERVGFSEKDFFDNYALVRDNRGGLDLDALFNQLSHQREFDIRKTRRSVDNLFANVDVFVHNDFFDFARGFSKEDLTLLSYGPTLSQREKIENSKVIPFFNEIIVTSRSKEESFPDILRKYPSEELFFVDDKADQIDRVKTVAPSVVVMKMERPGGRHTGIKSELADHIVKDFYDVAEIIKGKSK
ncbi:MAG: hypothetical protein WC180_03205 [Candidatus Paceibacterota bacterium]|jgi:FMN phosphatase YigB (HAD superfamily)